ncbi:PREDICTED: uncharacterized protein LOC109115383 isoform X2 [Nelumbo nucifera]|nr:PREDICTED: uncharacterized protein LOC109115383 isoform X2 [Nelumbo nucifera]
MDSQSIQIDDDSRQYEMTTWTDSQDKCLDLMVQQVKANNRPTSTFDTKESNLIMENFNKINNKAYKKEQFENKYHQLKNMHNNYYTLTNHTGVTVDPQAKRITANESVWDHLYSYKWVEQMRKKGCPHLEELDFIFSEMSPAGEMEFGNNKEPEHVSEAQVPWDACSSHNSPSESTANASQSYHDTSPSSVGQTRKSDSSLKKRKKTQQSSNFIYAMQTWAELNKSKLRWYNLEIEKRIKASAARQQMQSKERDTYWFPSFFKALLDTNCHRGYLMRSRFFIGSCNGPSNKKSYLGCMNLNALLSFKK